MRVWRRSSSLPSVSIVAMSKPIISLACDRYCLAWGLIASRSLPIPGYCAPCPVKRYAFFICLDIVFCLDGLGMFFNG